MKISKIKVICVLECILIITLFIVLLKYVHKYKDSQAVSITGTYAIKTEIGPPMKYIVLDSDNNFFKVYNSDGCVLHEGPFALKDNIIAMTSNNVVFSAIYSNGMLYVFYDNIVEPFTKINDILIYVTTGE